MEGTHDPAIAPPTRKGRTWDICSLLGSASLICPLGLSDVWLLQSVVPCLHLNPYPYCFCKSIKNGVHGLASYTQRLNYTKVGGDAHSFEMMYIFLWARQVDHSNKEGK